MPIRPENRARYPKDWPQLSHAAKERAGWKCQHPGCTARQYSAGEWVLWGGSAHHEWRQVVEPAATYAEARQAAAEADWQREHLGSKPLTVIVLTVAHLNHTPEDCRPENLAAMCQRHHLAYDAKHHTRTAYATRKAAAQTADLFDTP